jgi:hypothetical protein
VNVVDLEYYLGGQGKAEIFDIGQPIQTIGEVE